MSYAYVPTLWKDQIVEVDEYGKVVYERDEQGNIVYWKDSLGNIVVDPITKKPIPKPKLLQEGTRHTAARENNQEEGILKAHEHLSQHDKDIQRLRVQMELDGRAPGNSGALYDTLDGYSNKIYLQTAYTDVIAAVSAGATTIPVDSVEGFIPFTQVTIFDDVNNEDVLITAVNSNSIEVQALTKNYKKGAKVARSTITIDETSKKMKTGTWGKISVSISEVV